MSGADDGSAVIGRYLVRYLCVAPDRARHFRDVGTGFFHVPAETGRSGRPVILLLNHPGFYYIIADMGIFQFQEE